MSDELTYLAKVASERNKSKPWNLKGQDLPLHKALSLFVQQEGHFIAPQQDAPFIALAGTVADELIAVAETLNVVEEYSDEDGRISQYWYDMASNSIAVLKAAIRRAMPAGGEVRK